jgi:beta-lactam-binding protein with PASTA domain
VISGGPASAGVTNVEGLAAGAAVARLRQAGFKPTIRKQASPAIAPRRVISTDPTAGTLVQVGSTVTVFVSSGPAPVRVPDVTGQSQANAEAALMSEGLLVGTVTQQVSTQTPGTVLSSSPRGASSVPPGAKVNLTVAQAPQEVPVPDLVGKTVAQASAALGSAGLVPRTVNEPAEPPLVGTVLKQSPAAGAHARKGATVTITVGVMGTKTTTTPTTPTTPTTTGTTTTPPP